MADPTAIVGRRVAELTAGARIYRRLLGARVRSEWQYRTSFVLFLASQTLTAVIELATIAVLFGNVDTLAGWTVLEVVVIFALNTLAFGLAFLFAGSAEAITDHIRLGTFDVFLVRPVPALVQVFAAEFSLRRVGRLLQPLAALVIVLPQLDVRWSLRDLVLLPTAVVSGAVIFGALWVMTSCIAFWTVDSQQLGHTLTWGGKHLSDHPIGIFDRWTQGAVVFVVPLAFVAYLPAAVLLDKPVVLGLPRALAWAAPVVALALAGVAAALWRAGLRRYHSTGS